LEPSTSYLLALEGGGTRSQAAILDFAGRVVQISESGDVNTNFTTFQAAQQAVLSAVLGALRQAGLEGERITHYASALVGPRFGADLLGALIPRAQYHYYWERNVVFARAGLYRPHGVAVVAATGATAWAIRSDDGRQVSFGGWGSLLGDEGSAYAAGLLGLRAAARAFEGRQTTPTRLVEAVCQHLNLSLNSFKAELIRLAYQKPLSRAEIAGLAGVVTHLAAEGDPIAVRITAKVAQDMANLALHAARQLFTAEETFDVAAAGGLLKAGDLILSPLRTGLADEFPHARLVVGSEEPAIALGRLAIFDIAPASYKTEITEAGC
jgi:N-acetylglucosamine kinase-like BadF-type ATPase